MNEISPKNIGQFILQLRKEKNITQKELGEQLFLSDKTISKWERGVSMPDVLLLKPLGEILGVSIAEILAGERIDSPIDVNDVEKIVLNAIGLTVKEKNEASRLRQKWSMILAVCLLITVVEVGLLFILGYTFAEIINGIGAVELLMIIFAVGLCVFTKEKLPLYYDENKIKTFQEGFVRIRIPGVYFNNNNIKYVLRVGKIWTLSVMTVFPLIFLVITKFFNADFFTSQWQVAVILPLTLGMLIPMVIVAKKYENKKG